MKPILVKGMRWMFGQAIFTAGANSAKKNSGNKGK